MSTDIAEKTREMFERLHTTFREHLPMWVITKHPRNFPNDYVARLHMTLPVDVPTRIHLRRATLDELRAALPRGLHRLNRSPADDPVIVEVWL